MVTLPDKIHTLTFIFIIFHLVITVLAYRMSTADKMAKARKMDFVSFVVSLLLFVSINAYWVSDAISQTQQ